MLEWWCAVRADLDNQGYLYSINVERSRRVSIQAGPIGSIASSAVVEVKRAFGGVNSPSVSFATTQTIDLDGSSILEIDVTDTAWLHIVCTTAESGKSVQIETETSGVMQGTVMWESVDLDTVGVKSLANTSTAYKAFVLVDPQQTNSTATLEVKRRVDHGLEAISFASPASLTLDSATITEIDADGSGELVAVCGAVQAGQVVTLWWYLRGEVPGDAYSVEPGRVSLSSTTGSYTTTLVTLPFDRVDRSASWLSNSSGAITLSAGTYIVSADITTDESSGNNRTEFESLAQSNATGSYVAIPGTVRRHYSRLNAQGSQSASISFVITLTSSSEIRIQSRRVSGTGTGEWLADGSSVTIQKI